ncbi:MAG TPA: hypothetical protein VM534_09905 [Thermoanaerobaculia bacterium]|nr:hypothetical protein [Thermoanaerobaculia bacterium]
MRAILAVVCSLFVSCATISRGPYETIQIRSDPPGAVVDAECGVAHEPVTTPGEVRLRRKADPCLIRIVMEGYEPAEIALRRQRSGHLWGNLAIGGAATLLLTALLLDVLAYTGGSVGAVPFLLVSGAGIGIDYATGAVWEHEPNEIHQTLVRETDGER